MTYGLFEIGFMVFGVLLICPMIILNLANWIAFITMDHSLIIDDVTDALCKLI